MTADLRDTLLQSKIPGAEQKLAPVDEDQTTKPGGAPDSGRSVALLTFVLQEHHCVILEDWIRFFSHPLDQLVVHVGHDAAVVERLTEICESRNITFCNLGATTAQATTDDETTLLAAQFEATTADFACVVRLDTIPFRKDGVHWQDDAMMLLESSDACFVTGGALPFRADQPTDDPDFLLTQRISNCFMVIRPRIWKELQQGVEQAEEKYGRFSVEGVVEDNLVNRDMWGIRILNRQDLRVFHCQEWGLRLLDVRQTFIAGKNIGPYLKGFQDDFQGANARNYMEPSPPLARRIRIFVGKWRRQIFGHGGQ